MLNEHGVKLFGTNKYKNFEKDFGISKPYLNFVIAELENELNLQLPDSSLSNIECPADVVRSVEKALHN